MADISAKQVKELRDMTGAGMMDCKKALNETNADLQKAVEWLRQKGITSAVKKEGRIAAEGLVHSYIHTGGRVGVLVEVNCETDFVARRDEFKGLAQNIAMQIAACPNVEVVKVEDIPADMIERETQIEMGRDDLGNKPEKMRAQIVKGRIDKRLKELALMDQPFIKDQNITVEELVQQTVAKLGENIQVRRFTRFILGEGIEKEVTNFAEEVAAQTGAARSAAAPPVAPAEAPPGIEPPTEELSEATPIVELPTEELSEATPVIELPTEELAEAILPEASPAIVEPTQEGLTADSDEAMVVEAKTPDLPEKVSGKSTGKSAEKTAGKSASKSSKKSSKKSS